MTSGPSILRAYAHRVLLNEISLSRPSQLALLPLLGALCLFGQMNTGEIAGGVQDALGGALPGATVVVEQAQTGKKFTTTTNSSGQYLLTQLPIGTYSLKVNATNFKQTVVSNVELHVGDSLRHDITLQIGDANETVVVEADSGAIQPESAEIKDVIQSRQMVDLPLEDREFLDLAMLSEGVVRPPGGTRGDALQQAAGWSTFWDSAADTICTWWTARRSPTSTSTTWCSRPRSTPSANSTFRRLPTRPSSEASPER